VLRLVEKQAGAAIAAGDRDFTGYIAHVLFDDWDEVWADAARAGGAAGPLCARIRGWLQPVWGLRLPPADYAHNDLNLNTREGYPPQAEIAAVSAILDRLQAAGD
jgi:hypothetical protein